MKLFGKSTTLTLGAAMLALVGNESATAEQVDAANQELDTAGIKGTQLVPGAVLEDLTAKADIEEEPTDVAANQKIVDDLNAKMLGEV